MPALLRSIALLAALASACGGCDAGKAPSAPSYRQGNAAPLSDPPSSAP